MNENQSGLNTNISGGTQGVAGTNTGTVNIVTTYISQTNSEAQIRDRKLIEGSPYLGLEKFDVDDKDKFFGRDTWIIELTNYLAKENVLLLLGASGSGKSSLIQAGLIPKLKDQRGSQLFNFTFVPDVDPFESFYGCLLTKYKQSDAKIARIVQEDTLIKVVEFLKKEDIQWLIYIDQFEELFTRTPQNERDIFVKSLIQLIDKNDPTVKLVMTMRADFLDKLSSYPHLSRKIYKSGDKSYSHLLTDMEDDDLRLAIAEPAARNGVTFEKGLIDKIIADFKQQAGSLPLLQYTLNLLWKDDDINDRILNSKTYKDLGGVTVALQKQADKIYNELGVPEQEAAQQIFLELIELDGKKPVSRRVKQSSFSKDSLQVTVLSKLIDNRLLVSKIEDGKAKVEVAHEELLRSWKVLQDLIQDKEEIIILRTRLEDDAENWQKLYKINSPEARRYLLNDSQLDRIIKLYQDKSLQKLGPVTLKFLNKNWEYRQQRKKENADRKQREIDSELSLANSLGRYSLSIFKPERSLNALIEAIKAGKILQKHPDQAKDGTVVAALHKSLTQGMERNRLAEHGDYVSSVSFNPDGQTLASASSDRTIKLWKVETGEELRTLTGHGDYVTSVSFSPDGQTLASASGDHTIKLWKVETGEEILTLIGHEDTVSNLSFRPDGQTLASAGHDGIIKLWKVETGEELRALTGHEKYFSSVSFSPDGQTLASASSDRTIKLWKVETREELRTLTGHYYCAVVSMSFSPDGQTLASASGDRTIKLWEVKTGQELLTFTVHEGFVIRVIFSPDGQTLASASASGDHTNTIKLWEVNTGEELLTLIGHEDRVSNLSFSPDGKTLASASDDKTIKLWKVETGEQLRTLTGHGDYVSSVSFSPDGQTLASASLDKTIKLWKVETGEQLRTLTGHEDVVVSMSFSHDGQTLASISWDDIIKLWQVETGEQLRTITLTGQKDPVSRVSFRPDGQILASGSDDKTIKLWQVETGEELCTLTGHEDVVNRVIFSPDGQTLASASDDKTIKLWDLNLDSLMAKSCDWVRGYLTHNPKVSESDKHLCDGIGTQQ